MSEQVELEREHADRSLKGRPAGLDPDTLAGMREVFPTAVDSLDRMAELLESPRPRPRSQSSTA